MNIEALLKELADLVNEAIEAGEALGRRDFKEFVLKGQSLEASESVLAAKISLLHRDMKTAAEYMPKAMPKDQG